MTNKAKILELQQDHIEDLMHTANDTSDPYYYLPNLDMVSFRKELEDVASEVVDWYEETFPSEDILESATDGQLRWTLRNKMTMVLNDHAEAANQARPSENKFTDEDFQLVCNHYRDLIYRTASCIRTDNQARQLEDGMQDIKIAMLIGVRSFLKKKNIDFTDKLLDKSYGLSSEFEKYMKTVMWQQKSKVGKWLTKRYTVFNTPSLTAFYGPEGEDSEAQQDAEAACFKDEVKPASAVIDEWEFIIEDAPFTHDAKILYRLLMEDPNSFYSKNSGRLKKESLRKKTNMSKRQFDHAMENMAFALKDYNPNN